MIPKIVAQTRSIINGQEVPSPARDRLHEIAKPTLIIVGAGDLSYFHNIANVLVSDISGAQKVIVANAGHMVNMEAPDKVNELLAGFISKSKALL